MNLSKSTRYALYAAMEMALAGDDPVTVSGVAERYRISEGGLSKVFQQLVRSGIAIGIRGIGGGYRLARPPSQITVQDVIRVLEAEREEGRCLLDDRYTKPCVDFPTCHLRRLFDEVDELVRSTFESISLETLVRGPSLRASGNPLPAGAGSR
jgi:Rrf2 family transcriptional regulator, cysteine metabolism repressor